MAKKEKRKWGKSRHRAQSGMNVVVVNWFDEHRLERSKNIQIEPENDHDTG